MIIAGIFTDFQNVITNSNASILARSLALGSDIFITIFVSMIVIGLCKCAIAQDFSMFWWNMGSLLFKMIPPLAALNFSQIILPQLQSIADFFIGRISGGNVVNADSLTQLGLNCSLALVGAANAPLRNPQMVIGMIQNPANIPQVMVNEIVAVFAGIVIMFSFTWVAMELVLAWYQVLLSSAIGAASVGFFGSEATSDMAFRYTSGVIAGIWKVIFMTIWPVTVVGVYNSFTFIADINNPKTFFQTAISIITFGIVVAFATFRIVRMADSMFSGQSSFTLQDITRAVSESVANVKKEIKKRI